MENLSPSGSEGSDRREESRPDMFDRVSGEGAGTGSCQVVPSRRGPVGVRPYPGTLPVRPCVTGKGVG